MDSKTVGYTLKDVMDLMQGFETMRTLFGCTPEHSSHYDQMIQRIGRAFRVENPDVTKDGIDPDALLGEESLPLYLELKTWYESIST